MTKKAIGMFCVLFSLGCQARLYHDLGEQEANEMVVVLQSNGIESDKTPDEKKGKWVVEVPEGVKIDALRALAIAGLPKPKPSGYDAFYPSEGLIPTSEEEHVLRQYAQSQEIRKSLLTIDGVIDANVNLVLPRRSKVRLNTAPTEPARSSVVIKYSGAKPPVVEADVKRIVTGAVGAMSDEQVAVVFTPSKWAGKATPLEVVSVGPFAIAAGSKAMMQSVFGGLIALVIALSAVIVATLMRRRS